MEIVKDAAKEVVKHIPEKYRKPLVLIVFGALVSTWALAKLDERIDAKMKPFVEKHDTEMSGLNKQLKSIDDKLNIVIEKL